MSYVSFHTRILDELEAHTKFFRENTEPERRQALGVIEPLVKLFLSVKVPKNQRPALSQRIQAMGNLQGNKHLCTAVAYLQYNERKSVPGVGKPFDPLKDMAAHCA